MRRSSCSSPAEVQLKESARSVYLSARFHRREELNEYREALDECGVEVTSRWLTDTTPELTEGAWRELANKDREDIERAEVFVLFAEAGNAGGGGRHVEFGTALALRERLIVVGTAENLFQRLPEVEVVETWNDALRLIATPSKFARERA